MSPTAPLVPVSASGLLELFARAGVLELADVHVAQTLARLCKESDDQVVLAAALAVRALRLGSVCLDLAEVAERTAKELHDPALDPEPGAGAAQVAALPWPETGDWLARLAASPMVGQGAAAGPNGRPLRLVSDLLYLERYWSEETSVRRLLDARAARPVPPVNQQRLDDALDLLFTDPSLPAGALDRQREAAAEAAAGWTTVVAGGPGTGKTTTVARLLATLQSQTATNLRIALAAPSGKASARLEQAVAAALVALPQGLARPAVEPAVTLHKLLEARGAGNGFGRSASNPLPHDVVVVDEMSMVALPLMARLLEALRDDTRLVLVGDPNQLTSVEAGSVLADLVSAAARDDAPQRGTVVELTHTFRFGRHIAELAEAIRSGDAEGTLGLLQAGPDQTPDGEGWVRLTELSTTDLARLGPADLEPVREAVLSAGALVHAAAVAGDVEQALAHLDDHRLLCAHREGRFGVARWGRLAEDLLKARIAGYGADGDWYLGRPLLVTQNLRDLDLQNGDSGVVVRMPGQPGWTEPSSTGVRAAIGNGTSWRAFSPYLLESVTSLHAMTVHKAQGSQFDQVTMVLPPPDSPLLTRELLYTAVTRAKTGVHLVGDPDAVRRAVANPARRASGLGRGW